MTDGWKNILPWTACLCLPYRTLLVLLPHIHSPLGSSWASLLLCFHLAPVLTPVFTLVLLHSRSPETRLADMPCIQLRSMVTPPTEHGKSRSNIFHISHFTAQEDTNGDFLHKTISSRKRRRWKKACSTAQSMFSVLWGWLIRSDDFSQQNFKNFVKKWCIWHTSVTKFKRGWWK